MTTSIREAIKGVLVQGVDEQIAYQVTTTPWGSSPTNVAVVVKNSAGTDVTATVTSGTASVMGDVITLPVIKSLTAGEVYRVEVKFTVSGNILETFFWIAAEV